VIHDDTEGNLVAKRRAVVAGGAGFLGSHLCEKLLSEGYQVVCVDNLSTGIETNVEHLRDSSDFSFIRHDITEKFHIPGPVELTVNFASPASPADYLELPIQTMRVGAEGNLHLLDLARSKNSRYVLASTSEVYGDPDVHPQRETYWGNVNPVGPRSVYDEAKRYGEAITSAYRRQYAVNTAIIRIFNTYGPRMRPFDGRVVPTFIRQALADEAITVYGSGQQTRSLCYVDDLIEGVVRVASSTIAGPINIGNPNQTTVHDLANLITELCGSSSSLTFHPLPEDDPRRRCPDIAVAARVLDWTPVMGLREGLMDTIAWFAAQSPRVGGLVR
jgi:dTDP-glucose 4,6-dehydratase